MTNDSSNWRTWTLAERERQYSPSSCVAAIEPFLHAYAARSRDAETRFRCQKNLLWGERSDETFDYFPAASADAPLLISNSRKSERERMAVRACCAALGSGSKTRKYSLAPKNASMSNFARPVFQVRDLVGDRKRRMN